MRYLTLILVLFVAGCSGSNAPPLFEVGSAPSVSGTVTNINLEAMAVDGDGVITIETEDGSTARIFVAARMNLCAAEGLDSLGDISVGDYVEASGDAVGGTNIRPCESEAHYLRRVEE